MEALRSAKACWLRTSRHPSASLVHGARSFDYLYDSAESLEQVYAGIVEALVGAASSEGHVVYAVPGSPTVAERSVELLRADPRARTEVLPGVSFVDLAFERLGVDPLSAGVSLVDGQRFGLESAGRNSPLLVGQCDSAQVLSEVKLAVGAVLDDLGELGRPVRVTVLRRLGLPDESVFSVPWDEVDRVEPDHLTSLWVPELGAPFAGELVRLEELGRTLRRRCPWDSQQTHQSLTRYLLEEAYEALEAIEELGPDGAGYEHLEEELGDLLFQVYFHALLAREEGLFDLSQVARTVNDKLVSRHPHVFGDAVAHTADAVLGMWERRKHAEKGREHLFEGVPAAMPALARAAKFERKLESVGLGVRAATGPAEVGAAGAVLLALARRIAAAGADPEAALRTSLGRLSERLRMIEERAVGASTTLTALAESDPALLQAWWSEPSGGE